MCLMLNLLIITVVLLFYISLFVELYFYNIPSVVSNRKILKPDPLITKYLSENHKQIFSWPLFKKILLFVFPMVFIYTLHGLPILNLYELYRLDFEIRSPMFLFLLGLVLVVFGRCISHYYLKSIRHIKSKTFHGFVNNGVFRFSRNPGLIGLYISFLGFYLIKPSILFSVCFIIYVVHMHFKVKMEEDYLRHKYGENYEAYFQKTKRYL